MMTKDEKKAVLDFLDTATAKYPPGGGVKTGHIISLTRNFSGSWTARVAHQLNKDKYHGRQAVSDFVSRGELKDLGAVG